MAKSSAFWVQTLIVRASRRGVATPAADDVLYHFPYKELRRQIMATLKRHKSLTAAAIVTELARRGRMSYGLDINNSNYFDFDAMDTTVFAILRQLEKERRVIGEKCKRRPIYRQHYTIPGVLEQLAWV
jgi:hypothetical protein